MRRRGFWRTIKQAGGENGTRKINNSLCRSQGIFFGTAFVCACCRYTRPLPRPLSGTSKALPPSIPFCPLRELSLPCPSFPLPPSFLPPKREKRRRATSFIAVLGRRPPLPLINYLSQGHNGGYAGALLFKVEVGHGKEAHHTKNTCIPFNIRSVANPTVKFIYSNQCFPKYPTTILRLRAVKQVLTNGQDTFSLTLALCLVALACRILALLSRYSRRSSPSRRMLRIRKRSS